MKIGGRALRVRAARVLREVRQGREVTITYRNRAVGVIKPVKNSRRRAQEFEPIGFGLWADRKDLADVPGWVRKARRPRYSR